MIMHKWLLGRRDVINYVNQFRGLAEVDEHPNGDAFRVIQRGQEVFNAKRDICGYYVVRYDPKVITLQKGGKDIHRALLALWGEWLDNQEEGYTFIIHEIVSVTDELYFFKPWLDSWLADLVDNKVIAPKDEGYQIAIMGSRSGEVG